MSGHVTGLEIENEADDSGYDEVSRWNPSWSNVLVASCGRHVCAVKYINKQRILQ